VVTVTLSIDTISNRKNPHPVYIDITLNKQNLVDYARIYA